MADKKLDTQLVNAGRSKNTLGAVNMRDSARFFAGL